MLIPVAIGVIITMFLIGFPQFLSGGEGKYIGKWLVIGLIFNIIFQSAYIYLFTPALTGPLAGLEFLWLPLLVNGISALIMAAAVKSGSSDGQSRPHWAAFIGILFGFAIIIVLWIVVSIGNWIGQDKAKLAYANIQTVPMVAVLDAKGKETGQAQAPIPGTSEKHIRIVSTKNAVNRAAASLQGDMGSVYQWGKFTPQKVNGHQYHVALLEYKDWFTSWGRPTTPGYILIDAENPLVESDKMIPYSITYFDGNFFNSDINRHLYLNGYTDWLLVDPTAELNDNGKLFETVGLAKYKFGWEGIDVQKMAIVDVQTGEIQTCDIGKCPEWIDRVLPDNATNVNVKWYGMFVNAGWFNLANTNTQKYDDDPVVVYNADSEQNSWQYLMTSTNQKDNTGIGVVLYSSVERKGLYYKFDKPISIGSDVVNLFQGNPIMKQQGLGVDQLLLVNIYGTNTWVATMSMPSSYGSKYQYMAMVRASISSTSADVQYDKNPEIALRNYQNWLASHKNTEEVTANRQNVVVKVEGVITSIGTTVVGGNTNHIFTMSDMKGNKITFTNADGTVTDRIFVGLYTPQSIKLPIAQKGDHVLVIYQDTATLTVAIESFEDYDVPPAK